MNDSKSINRKIYLISTLLGRNPKLNRTNMKMNMISSKFILYLIKLIFNWTEGKLFVTTIGKGWLKLNVK